MYSCVSKLCRGFINALNNDWEKRFLKDLEDEMEDIWFDAESGSGHHSSIDLKVSTEPLSKSIKELYREEVAKQTFEEIQSLRSRRCCSSSLSQTINQEQDNIIMLELLSTIKQLQEKVEGKKRFDVVKTDKEDQKVLHVLDAIMKNTNDIKNRISFVERNNQRLNVKYATLKVRIANIEKETMKNSMQMISMDYSHRTLSLLQRPNIFDERSVSPFAENRFYGNPLPADAHYYPQQPVVPPTTPAGVFTPTGSSSSTHGYISRLQPPVTSTFVPPPPPPPPPVTSAFGPPPPKEAVGSSPAAAPAEGTAPKTFGRMAITEDMLKSVVLKPPGQRKVGNRISAKN